MSRHSIKCYLWKALWSLSVLSFAMVWVAIFRKAPVFNLSPEIFLWSSLILGVLATPIKLDCQSCGSCSVRPM